MGECNQENTEKILDFFYEQVSSCFMLPLHAANAAMTWNETKQSLMVKIREVRIYPSQAYCRTTAAATPKKLIVNTRTSSRKLHRHCQQLPI